MPTRPPDPAPFPFPTGVLSGLAGVIVALASCSKEAPVPAVLPTNLAQVPAGYGTTYQGQPRLTVKSRVLALPSGETCSTAESCKAALGKLGAVPLALELDKTLVMAELSVALAALDNATPAEQLFCLLVVDGRSLRCVPFRPFSGEEFGAWLDAEKPIGKIRAVMRSDGIEVVADRGKVPGPDRFGPSLPALEGKPDFEGVEAIFAKLKRRFEDENQAVLAPSPSMRIEWVGKALGLVSGKDAAQFPTTYLVFP